jgi:hypothetical protein
MGFLHNAIERIKGQQRCDKLVQRIGNEVSLSTSIDAGIFKINVGNFSRVIKEIVTIPDTAVALDDSQYHMCVVISNMKDNTKLKDDCIRIRLMIIMGFNQLRAILASIQEEPTEELKRELAKWLRYMGDLNMHSISLLDPTSAAKDKAGTTLDQIREYQGTDQVELQEAVNQVK